MSTLFYTTRHVYFILHENSTNTTKRVNPSRLWTPCQPLVDLNSFLSQPLVALN